MIEVLAERGMTTQPVCSEAYGHSLRMVRGMGRVTLDQTVRLEEREAIETLAFADFKTAVAEMLKTDPDFREHLDVTPAWTHRIIDGQAVNDDGTAMADIVEMGAHSSASLAARRPELAGQAERDAADVLVARRADSLQPGMTLWGISMDPKEDMARHKKIYTGLGYREGLAYLQAYTRVDEQTLTTRSYSVDASDTATWRTLLQDFGMTIPEGISSNVWLEHAIEVPASAEEAKALLIRIRTAYYQTRGLEGERLSINEYVDRHEATVKNYFETYYRALGQAVCTGQNNDVLHDFATTLMQVTAERIKPEIRVQLLRVMNLRRFDDEAGKAIDSLIRYALAEHLRRGLGELVRTKMLTLPQPGYIHTNPLPLAELHAQLVSNIYAGIKAGRSYGGCPGNTNFANELSELANLLVGDSPQEPYGGKTKPKDCEFTSLECPKCHKKKVHTVVRNGRYYGDCGCVG